MSDGKDGPVYVATMTLVSVLLQTFSWLLTTLLFLGRLRHGADWPGAYKEWVALAVSLAFTAFFRAWGRRHIQEHYLPIAKRGIAVTAPQAVVVIVLVVLCGLYSGWLFEM